MNNQQNNEETINHKMDIAIKWDDETNFFLIRFLKDDHPIFTVQLLPENFEILANSMLKNVKDYNLKQAKEFMEKRDAEKQKSNPTDGAVLQDSTCTDTGCKTEQQQPASDNG